TDGGCRGGRQLAVGDGGVYIHPRPLGDRRQGGIQYGPGADDQALRQAVRAGATALTVVRKEATPRPERGGVALHLMSIRAGSISQTRSFFIRSSARTVFNLAATSGTSMSGSILIAGIFASPPASANFSM